MIYGVLVVNLDPSYIGFEVQDTACIWRHCEEVEIRELLLDLDVIPLDGSWPIQEFILRAPGEFPHKILLKYGLIETLSEVA